MSAPYGTTTDLFESNIARTVAEKALPVSEPPSPPTQNSCSQPVSSGCAAVSGASYPPRLSALKSR
ncbi:hypothetical protein XFLAVUS301_44250 [Xanthobacter flavus]|uniref:Uncharacterized protein n=1 Tax=Xanthobacter flavus TaxID=281 RepID=A0A9W6FLU4_XANFL|nr:hypothetical protein XFLAVUS301_44250 [Xanthobacter flavus]